MRDSDEQPSLRRAGPWAGTAFVVATLALSMTTAGCGYGTATVWNPPGEQDNSDSNPGDDPGFSEPDYEADPVSPGATACRRIDGASAGPSPARLLTNYEYENSVHDLVGTSADISGLLPAENKVGGFENNATTHVASKTRVRKFMTAAEEVAKRAVEQNFDGLLPCDPMAAGELACGKKFVDKLLLRAFRRPPTDAELTDFQTLFEQSHGKYGFVEAVELTLQAVLQSPQFLYRLEYIDPSKAGKSVKVDDWQMATRLSYLLWSSIPDKKLREAARNGELSTEEQIEAQARRMLEDPKAKDAVYQFHRQWLKLDGFGSVVKDSDRFPSFQDQMTAAWHKSLKAFVEHIYFKEGGNVAELLTSSMVFLPDSVQTLYEAASGAAEVTVNGIEGFRFPQDRRAGLITQPALMALLANANQSSPIRRGVWMRERLLCQHIPPPPPSSDLKPPDPDPDATTRERFRQHTANPQCASCHKLIDPIGFGFENYDSLGRWRERENGRKVDATGKLSQTSTPALEGPFDGAVALADKLKKSDQVRNCIASKWFTYAMGRHLKDTEKCSLYHVQQAFSESDGSFRSLLVNLATSEAFRYRAVPEDADTAASTNGSQGGQ